MSPHQDDGCHGGFLGCREMGFPFAQVSSGWKGVPFPFPGRYQVFVGISFPSTPEVCIVLGIFDIFMVFEFYKSNTPTFWFVVLTVIRGDMWKCQNLHPQTLALGGSHSMVTRCRPSPNRWVSGDRGLAQGHTARWTSSTRLQALSAQSPVSRLKPPAHEPAADYLICLHGVFTELGFVISI